MLVGAHRHEYGDAEVDLARVDQGHMAGDEAVLAQPLDAPPAGRGREVYRLCHVGQRGFGIALQHRKNLPVNRIQFLFHVIL
ncbi:hypothetical protein FQZ97_985030 [compost metagenome]